MGNFFSSVKKRKSSVNFVTQEIALDDKGADTSPKTRDQNAVKLLASADFGNCRVSKQMFNSTESTSQKIKSIEFRVKQGQMTQFEMIKNESNERRKSYSASMDQNLGRSKSLSEMQRKESTTKGPSKSVSRKQSTTRVRSSISLQQCRGNKLNRRETHPISYQGREIIQACFDNPHAEIGHRICMRVFEKRLDYQRFIYALGKERWPVVTGGLRDYLDNVVHKVHDLAAVEDLSRNYGEQHVLLKSYGFKPDFWVSLADAMTLECVILDMANHQPTETVAAWSQLVSLMFTSIRDGYYAELRSIRISVKRKKDPQRQSTIRSSISLDESSETIVEELSSEKVSSPVTEDESQMESLRSKLHLNGLPERMYSSSVTSASTKSSTVSPANSVLSSSNTFATDSKTIFY